MAEHDVTKTTFSQTFIYGFSEILVGDVELMPEQVLKVFRRYLLSFLSCRQNTGAVSTPPLPTAARVKEPRSCSFAAYRS